VSETSQLGEKYSYHLLCREVGTDKANKIIAAKLRAFADAVESNNDPSVFSCEIANLSPSACKGVLMEELRIVLSHLWPG